MFVHPLTRDTTPFGFGLWRSKPGWDLSNRQTSARNRFAILYRLAVIVIACRCTQPMRRDLRRGLLAKIRKLELHPPQKDRIARVRAVAVKDIGAHQLADRF